MTFAIRATWLLILAFLAGCQNAPPPDVTKQEAIRQLLVLIDQRLNVAPLVARAKWNSGAPIDDPVREQQILEAVSAQAAQAGLDATFASRFFQSQFDAGKLLQHALHRQWQIAGQPRFADAPDLGRDVRPILDHLTPQIIDELKTVYPLLRNPAAQESIEMQGRQLIRGDVNGIVRDAALKPLLQE